MRTTSRSGMLRAGSGIGALSVGTSLWDSGSTTAMQFSPGSVTMKSPNGRQGMTAPIWQGVFHSAGKDGQPTGIGRIQ
ncbi:hypothetical protein SVIO_019190 [Streptomyces violaceusniger]|uniref:Uncharacterized protein n=1 Tax=Streptomyces violaceusniger TaxID=68280 RepID=A0A4D4KWP7_STRVO|nr:hypothetical protein SVIO_019190 [Streptomyces violaceusniger]